MLKGLNNQRLEAWVRAMVELSEPDEIHLCDGSREEYDRLCDQLVKQKTFIRLNEKSRPHSFLARSNPKDVARMEGRTFICSEKKEDAGPTNNWKAPAEMEAQMKSLFKGCMHGRTLYIVPFNMGPLGSPLARIGVEITDSPYVVCNMRIMTRMGDVVLAALGEQGDFIPCMHSVGQPLTLGQSDSPWPCNPDKTVIAHFPEKRTIWSFGSGYGGNALLGKKCFALRIASVMAKEEGWLAEHMLIVGVTNPAGKKKYFAAAFPSACGKTNLAMLKTELPGWKIECVGDDIAWMKFSEEGVLHAINPEAGFFGVAPGTAANSNPNALATCAKNSIFTNVALTKDHDVWWEGLTESPPPQLINWQGVPWNPENQQPAAHPNSRFTAPANQCPVIDPAWEDRAGVPISAIIFGGRRSTVVPLVYEAFDWNHGVFMGCSISSETTAAAEGQIGKLRHDPFAMLPFCGYNMGDYFEHWLSVGHQKTGRKLPHIFSVNWFRRSKEGKFLWPGFGENARVLKWCFERIEETAAAEKSPIGWIPQEGALDIRGLAIHEEQLKALFEIKQDEWLNEVKGLRSYFSQFGSYLPKEIEEQLNQLEQRLG